MAKEIEHMEPPEIIKYHEQNVLASLQKYGIKQQLIVHYKDKKVPILGKFGAWLVNKTGGVIATKYSIDNAIINSNSRHK